jgi:extradiol dioxygenase family protein
LQKNPSEVRPLKEQGKRHFGVVLPWHLWEKEVERLRAASAQFLGQPKVLRAGTPEEQGKFYLEDPGHNVIEIKAYRNAASTLGITDAQA